MNLKIINIYSKKLKKSPDFTDCVMVEKLCFRGCESLQKVLPETIGQLGKLGQFDMHGCVNLKRLPLHIKLLTNLSSLYLGSCTNLIRLPEQLGDMKGLKKLDASHTPIEQLPDSIVHLKELVSLKLINCEKLRKLPEQFGNMVGLEKFIASNSGIEELPDSIGQLINLTNLKLSQCRNLASLPDSIVELKLIKELYMNDCLKLERLPKQLGKMQSLERIFASETAIQELPDSVLLLSRLTHLNLHLCSNLTYVPSNILNLTSLVFLFLPVQYIFTSNIPVNHMKKLECLSLRCDIRSWLPTILSFSSLRQLSLWDEGKSLSSTKLFSLSKLNKLEFLTLNNWGFSLSELPLNLKHLWLSYHVTLEQLPDLSSLEQLEILDIWNCNSLQSLPPLPLNLKELSVHGCTSLKDVPDLSILKNLKTLRFLGCSNLKSVDLKQSYLQVLPPFSIYSSFSADLPNKEIAEWFDIESSGGTVSLSIPSSSVLGDDFLGIALWVVFKCHICGYIKAVITNKTEGIKKDYNILVVGGEAKSRVQCISRHEISMKSGDKIKVSFQKSLYFDQAKIPGGGLKVEKCGAHVILQTLSTP